MAKDHYWLAWHPGQDLHYSHWHSPSEGGRLVGREKRLYQDYMHTRSLSPRLHAHCACTGFTRTRPMPSTRKHFAIPQHRDHPFHPGMTPRFTTQALSMAGLRVYGTARIHTTSLSQRASCCGWRRTVHTTRFGGPLLQ